MDQLTLERIKILHPKIRKEILEAYLHINNTILGKGVRLRFSHTYRSFEGQNQLFSIGRTKSGKIITNAKAGHSSHNYGLAFDIVLLLDKNHDGVFETASWDIKSDFDKDTIPDWMETVRYLKQLGWEWGGDWKSFPDYPHFEKTFGLTSKQLLSKFQNGDVFEESINGKIYKWVNL